MMQIKQCFAARVGEVPRLATTQIPTPPNQHNLWIPPRTELPSAFVSATESLFKQGLADPRGCEYREIEVVTGSCWGGAEVQKVRGWVIPARGDEKQRFAVCWNGLVYPVVSVGDEADMRADAEKVIAADEQRRATHAKDRPDWTSYRQRNATSEATSVSHESMLPIRACLLLRLGEVALVEKLWTAWTAGMRPNTNDDSVHLNDSYIMLATDWLWALFDRAVCAHLRGDDKLALVSARALVPIWNVVEKEAEKRKFKRPSGGRQDEPKYLGFLEPIHALLADQERRAKGARDEKKDAKPEDAEARISALIGDLENVASRQMGQPGGVSLGSDPIVIALIREGNASVEPLLDCLEKDTRLTRSVHFHRDFFRHRSLIGVHEAAYVALSGILKTSFFGAASTGDDLSSRGEKGRKAVAASIRAYWKRFKDVPLTERWYQTLSNDQVSSSDWLQAAQNIVRHTDVDVTPGSMFGTGWITVPTRTPEKPKLKGEMLRNKKDPSVADLMARRVADLSVNGSPKSSDEMFRMHKACKMALYLAQWDLEASVPTLRSLSKLCRSLHAQGWNGNDWTSQILADYVAEMTCKRVEADDKGSLDEYVQWLEGLRPNHVEDYLKGVFKPLWTYGNRSNVAAAAERIFNSPESPWGLLINSEDSSGYKTKSLFETPLVCLPAFQRHLIRNLGNHAEAGTVTVRPSGSINIAVNRGWSTSGSSYLGDPLRPEPGGTVTFRICDVYAHLLSPLDGTPAFKLYWPKKNRDVAVGKYVAFLRQYGERYEGQLSSSPGENLRFADLGHPATKGDVTEGRAIFSLSGEKVRVWKLPTRPMKAKWITLKDYPRASFTWDSKTKKSLESVTYDQNGHVWQAEEVLEGGKWKRFYGFVGRYGVAKVPAEEIEFPNDYGWNQLSNELDCKILPPGRREDRGMVAVKRLGLGDPLIVQVLLRNRAGTDRTSPTKYYQRNQDRPPRMIAGLGLTLSRNLNPIVARVL